MERQNIFNFKFIIRVEEKRICIKVQKKIMKIIFKIFNSRLTTCH